MVYSFRINFVCCIGLLFKQKKRKRKLKSRDSRGEKKERSKKKQTNNNVSYRNVCEQSGSNRRRELITTKLGAKVKSYYIMVIIIITRTNKT